MMSLNINQLDSDIIITVCILLHPADLLSFIQTCRFIHDLGSTDYVWHNISIDLPLDVDRRLSELSASDIKRAVIYALKLEENWNKPVPKVSRVSRILSIEGEKKRSFDNPIQPLGGNWVIASRMTTFDHPFATSKLSISICYMHAATDKNTKVTTTCAIVLQPERANKFRASFRRKDSICIISAFTKYSELESYWTIYKLELQEPRSAGGTGKAFLLKEHILKSRNTTTFLSEISGSIAALVRSNDSFSNNVISWVLLFNTETNATLRILTPESTDNGVWLEPSIRFHLPYIVMIASYPDKLKVFVREVPKKILSDKVEKSYPSDSDNIPTVDWESSVVDYETTPLDYAMPSSTFEPSDGLSDLTSLSIMAYTQLETEMSPDFSDVVDFFRFPIDTTKRNVHITGWQPSFTFGAVSKMRLHPDYMTMTGNRVVWRTSHMNASDRDDITMAYFPPTQPTVAPIVRQLILPNSGVPFDIRWCPDGLHLEEASGRLFVTHELGETYLSEYGPL